MSLSQIKKFVAESLSLEWKWQQITLIGGEPTLHKQFWEILAELKVYKSANPSCTIEIATNGFGPRVRRILSKLPPWIQVDNSQKTSNYHSFDSYNVAPIDDPQSKDFDFSKGCWITNQCGMGLTKNGYYPCGAGGSLDRVFGFDVGAKQLSHVSPDSLTEQLSRLCQNCGHFKANFGAARVREEMISPTWQSALAAYKEQKPRLESY